MFLQKYKSALDVILKKPIMLWGLSLLLVIVTFAASAVTISVPFLSLAVGYLFACGSAKLYLDGLQGKEVNSKQLFYAFNKNCVRTAGVMAWRDLWSFIWFLVPVYGIVKMYSYRFVPYIIVTHPEISAFDALKISMKMTKGKKLQMWLADLVFAAAPTVVGLILGLMAKIPVVGSVFGLAAFLVSLAVALFGSIFTGLYQAAFFNEEEVAQYIDAPAAVEPAVEVLAAE